jgi:hypothetical protein
MARAPLRHHLFKGKEEPEFGFVHKPLRPPADPLDQIRTMGFERGNLPSGGRKVGLKFRDLAPALPCKIRDQHRDTSTRPKHPMTTTCDTSARKSNTTALLQNRVLKTE